jgi:hypothetical protein
MSRPVDEELAAGHGDQGGQRHGQPGVPGHVGVGAVALGGGQQAGHAGFDAVGESLQVLSGECADDLVVQRGDGLDGGRGRGRPARYLAVEFRPARDVCGHVADRPVADCGCG